jgi:hypothetical protein
MSMDDDEWRGVCLLMERGFKGDLGVPDRKVYRQFIGKFDSEIVIAALHKLVEQGQVWLPKAGEIVAAIRALQAEADGGPVPSWTEALRMLRRGHAARVGYFDSNADKTATVLAWHEKHGHPVVAAFYRAEGGYERFSNLGLDDPEHGGAREHLLSERWREFVDVAQVRLENGHALVSAGARPAIEGPRRLSATAFLETAGLARPKELEA